MDFNLNNEDSGFQDAFMGSQPVEDLIEIEIIDEYQSGQLTKQSGGKFYKLLNWKKYVNIIWFSETKASKAFKKQKRQSITLEKQKVILDYLEKGESYAWIEGNTGIKRSTIAKIKLRKDKILEKISQSKGALKLKKIRTTTHPELEEALYYWFLSQRACHAPLSLTCIQAKTTEYHKQMCNKEVCQFKSSYGWCQKFCARHDIRSLKICGEKLSADTSAIQPSKLKLLQAISEVGVGLEMIFNADESSLFWRLLPNSSLVASHEKNAPGRKAYRDRITFMPCANVTGTLKPALQVIAKAARPRCFNSKILPGNIAYMSSRNAWQTRVLFKKWYLEVFRPVVEGYCKSHCIPFKAILILDNASCHSIYDDLSDENIKVVFLPPNCTSVIQPMDQHVINPLKLNYRKKMMQKIMLGQDWTQELKNLTLYDGVKILGEAWDELQPNIFIQSWTPLLEGYSKFDELKKSAYDEANVNKVGQLKALFDKIGINLDESSLNEWVVTVDAQKREFLTDEDIINIVKGVDLEDHPENNIDDDSLEADIEIQIENVQEHYDELKQVDAAFCSLIEFFKKQNDHTKLLNIKNWREEFLEQQLQ